MNYKETEQKLNEMKRNDEMMLRMGVSHLMDVGIRHLTEENIKHTCASLMNEDDSNWLMTKEFQCEIVRTAGELAKLDHVHLLVWVSQNIEYDCGQPRRNYIDPLSNFIESEVPFRLEDILELDVDEDEIEYITYELEENVDVMFDYDGLDRFLMKKHEEYVNEQ